MSARRGELWLVDFGGPVGREPSGTRPAVVASADALNEGPSGVLMVVPVTSTRRGLPSHVEIDGPDSGLDEVGYAKCEDLKSISDRRLVHRIGTLDSAAIEELREIAGVRRVFPKMKLTVPAVASGGGWLLGSALQTELVVDGIDPALVADEVGPALQLATTGLPAMCDGDRDCGDGAWCAPTVAWRPMRPPRSLTRGCRSCPRPRP